ncbi:hypothetical protein O181_031269 [Austropuccinia psidii MF-1]|uniref:Rust transferred protein n=1 Tax=Austropuccinia psidii MF-1 TaxID=1389203 RepID=A0A9Q3CVD4_9BASI|nr:hypothetical protein [Austropuccinia psidii MF-1]
MLSSKFFLTFGAFVSLAFPAITAETSPDVITSISMKSFAPKNLVRHYQIGRDGQRVNVMVYSTSDSLARRAEPNPNNTAPGTIKLDLTPARCTSKVCYPGAFNPPDEADCIRIIDAQLYNSTGSLNAKPGEQILVYTGTCAVIFQNPSHASGFTLQYNWASLGLIVQALLRKCFHRENQSIGGVCKFKHYLGYTFTDVLISLQRVY